jgi:hypothetical protein
MNFGQALEALKANKKVARTGWDATKTWLFLIPQGANLASPPVTLAQFIAMKTTDGPIVPWTASPYDLLAENWLIVL